MSWDYADLSHMAKEAGGPDLLLSTLEASARGQGRIEGAGIGAVVAGSLFAGAALVYKQYSKKKALANQAKVELASGIHAYEMTEEEEESVKEAEREKDERECDAWDDHNNPEDREEGMQG